MFTNQDQHNHYWPKVYRPTYFTTGQVEMGGYLSFYTPDIKVMFSVVDISKRYLLSCSSLVTFFQPQIMFFLFVSQQNLFTLSPGISNPWPFFVPGDLSPPQ